MVDIPALLPDQVIPSAARTYRYPTEEAYGSVWVWPGKEEGADPALIPNILPGCEQPRCFSSPAQFAVDLDVDHSLLVETFLDPSHIPFALHNRPYNSNVRDARHPGRPLPLRMDVDTVDISQWANSNSDYVRYAIRGKLQTEFRPNRPSPNTRTEFYFVPPCHIVIRTQYRRFVEYPRVSLIAHLFRSFLVFLGFLVSLLIHHRRRCHYHHHHHHHHRPYSIHHRHHSHHHR